MKILHIINDLKIGGAQRLVTDIATELAKNDGLEIGILTIMSSDASSLFQEVKDNSHIHLYELNAGKSITLGSIKRIRKIIKQYDVVHSHLFPSGYLTALATLFLKKPLIYTEHSTSNRRREKRILRPLERWIYNRYSGVVGISDSVTEALNFWLLSQRIKSKTHTITNGVNLERIKTETPGDEKRVWGADKKAVVMISRFTSSKDHATVIKAISLIKDRNVVAVFVGDGETLVANKKLAKELGVEERCLFLGERSNPSDFVSSSSIGVQSSHWEGFGLTVVEMMAGGLPVVASDVPGLNEVVGGAGVLFRQGDYRQLASIFERLLNDPKEYKEIKEKCIARSQKYNITSTTDNYLALYRTLLARR